jgi:hypothetical protein
MQASTAVQAPQEKSSDIHVAVVDAGASMTRFLHGWSHMAISGVRGGQLLECSIDGDGCNKHLNSRRGFPAQRQTVGGFVRSKSADGTQACP